MSVEMLLEGTATISRIRSYLLPDYVVYVPFRPSFLTNIPRL